MSGTGVILVTILFIFYLESGRSSTSNNGSVIGKSSSSGMSYNSQGEKRLVHHNIAKENTSRALTRWLNPNEFKWLLSGASWITETQTYYLIGDDGAFCMVQMGYSNLT